MNSQIRFLESLDRGTSALKYDTAINLEKATGIRLRQNFRAFTGSRCGGILSGSVHGVSTTYVVIFSLTI